MIMLLLVVVVTVQVPQALELEVSVLLAPHCSFQTISLLFSLEHPAPLNFVPSDLTSHLCCCYLQPLGPSHSLLTRLLHCLPVTSARHRSWRFASSTSLLWSSPPCHSYSPNFDLSVTSNWTTSQIFTADIHLLTTIFCDSSLPLPVLAFQVIWTFTPLTFLSLCFSFTIILLLLLLVPSMSSWDSLFCHRDHTPANIHTLSCLPPSLKPETK